MSICKCYLLEYTLSNGIEKLPDIGGREDSSACMLCNRYVVLFWYPKGEL